MVSAWQSNHEFSRFLHCSKYFYLHQNKKSLPRLCLNIMAKSWCWCREESFCPFLIALRASHVLYAQTSLSSTPESRTIFYLCLGEDSSSSRALSPRNASKKLKRACQNRTMVVWRRSFSYLSKTEAEIPWNPRSLSNSRGDARGAPLGLLEIHFKILLNPNLRHIILSLYHGVGTLPYPNSLFLVYL